MHHGYINACTHWAYIYDLAGFSVVGMDMLMV